MKKFVSLLFLIYFLPLSSAIAVERKGSLDWHLTTPQEVSERANQGSKSFSSPMSDAMQNPFVSGYGDMIRGASGGTYDAVEMRKQQIDYASQQNEDY